MNKFTVLLILILLIESIGILGGLFFSTDSSWYANLNKPEFNPPSWVFGPVWTMLYLLIALSVFYVIYSEIEASKKRLIYFLFVLQLFLNGIWTPIFFGLKNIFLALMVIILLFITIMYLQFLFFRYRKISFYLFLPYLLWVLFAMILNFSILYLN